MFGFDPETLKNLAGLQAQIQQFIANTGAALARIEQRQMQLQAQITELEKVRENG